MISEALPPAEPSFPKTKILLPAAVVFGIVFGLLVVYLLEIADSTFRSGDDVRAVLGLPCFALIPAVRARLLGRIRMEDYVVRKPLSPFSEQIRALRAGLWLDSVHPKIVAITAARPAEAKTTTAMALGRSSAMNGERVLVLDCDVRQPSFGRLMRAEHSRGIVDYLLGQADAGRDHPPRPADRDGLHPGRHVEGEFARPVHVGCDVAVRWSGCGATTTSCCSTRRRCSP